MRRRLLLAAAVLLGCAALLLVSLTSQRFADKLRDHLASMVEERSGLVLSIGHLELGLLPPRIRVSDVRLSDPTGPTAPTAPPDQDPLLLLHRGVVRIRPWPAADGRWVVTHLELDGLAAHLKLSREGLRARAAAAAAAADSRDTSSGDLPVVLRRLSVWNARLEVELDDDHFVLENANLTFHAGASGNALALKVDDGAVTWHGKKKRIELLVRALLEGGQLLRPAQVSIEIARLHIPGATLEARGRLGIAAPTTSDIEITGKGPLRVIRELIPRELTARLPAIDGDVAAAKVRLRGNIAQPAVRAEAQIEHVAFGAQTYGDLRFNASYARLRANVEAFQWQHPQAGTVTGSGSIELEGRVPVAVTARLHNVRLEEVLELCRVPDSWVTLGVDGDVHAKGELRPARLDLRVALRLPDFATLDGSYRAAARSQAILAFDGATVTGDAVLTAAGIDLHDVVVHRADTDLTVTGLLAFSHEQGFDLRASSPDFALEAPGPIVGLTLAGRGPLAATLKGPYSDPTISGTVTSDALVIGGWYVGATKATVVYQGQVLRFDRVVARLEEGKITAQAAIDFAGPGATRIDATYKVGHMAARELLERAGVSHAVARRFAASLSGTGTLSGPIARPVGIGKLQAPNVGVDHNDFGPIIVRWGFGGERDTLWGGVTVSPLGGHAKAQAALRRDGQLRIEAHLTDIALDVLHPMLGAPFLGGKVTGDVALEGPPHALTGEFAAGVRGFTVAGLRLGQTQLRARAQAGHFVIDGTLLGGEAPLHATVDTTPGPWEHHARVDLPLPGIEISRLWGAAKDAANASANASAASDVSLTLHGVLESEGDLLQPAAISAAATVEAATLAWNQLRLTADQPWRALLRGGSLHVEKLSMRGEGLRLAVHGLLRAGAPTTLDATISGDLGRLFAMWPGLGFASGPFDAHLRVRGSLDTPQFEGSISVRDAAARIGDGRVMLERLTTLMTVSGRSLTVESGTARLGSGGVTLSGGATWPAGETPQFALAADLDGAEFQPVPQARVKATGDLHLTGLWGDMLLKGRLRLDSLRYTTSLELENFLTRRHAPLAVPALVPGRALALRIALQAPNNLVLSSNVLEAEFKTDLMLTGTTDRPGLVGNLTPLWARARYRDHDFSVERASIDFVEEFRITPQFQVQARADGCGMQINVNISGNADQYVVSPSGRDENGDVDPQDVLACLQFGLRLEDFSGHDGAGFPQVSWGGLDALWTVSGMDEKVRRLLPIKVDAFRLTSSWSVAHKKTAPHVMLTKEVGDKLELKYLGSLTELNDLSFSLDYQLSDEATLQGSWANLTDVPLGDLGVDLRLRWEFR